MFIVEEPNIQCLWKTSEKRYCLKYKKKFEFHDKSKIESWRKLPLACFENKRFLFFSSFFL